MEDFQFQRWGAAAAVPGKVAAGGRAKPAACYDDVFGGPTRSSLVPARPEDYREIFGAAAACSIPVLDLPPPPGDGYELRQCSALDYLDIFGSFGSGNFAASYQELFASQDSNGIGAPLPSEPGNAALVTGTTNSRGLNGMGCEKQEIPASGIITEGPSRDQFGCSLNGVAHNLNDGTNLLKGPNHIASRSSESDPDGSIHKNQVHAIPGFAFVVKNTEIDKPYTQVDLNVFFDSKCPKETSDQEHPRKAVLSTSSCSDVKCSANGMKDVQRSTQLEFSGPMITSAYKEDASYPSKNQSSVARSNGFSAKLSNYASPDKKSMEKKTETNCQNETVLNFTSASSGNDLKVRSTASEDVSANEKHFSCSSNGHSASSGTKSSPDRLMDDIIIDAGNIRITEANHPKKPMPGSPPCTSPQSSENMTTNQKKSDSMSNPPKNATVDEVLHARSSSTHSMSSLDPSCPDGKFLTVSDISLRTQPSHGPPPARPPPARPPSRFDLSGRNLRRTLTDYQKYDVGTGIAYKSQSFKQVMRDGSPPPFDVEMDASSAAAASVAAIKEAMELAQARLKSAKVSRERKKDNLQSRRKLGLSEDLSGINRDGHECVQENQRIREEVVVQLACEKTDGQKNAFAAENMATALNPSLMAGDFKEKERNCGSVEVSLQAMHGGEPEVSRLPNIKQDKAGEWKVEEQFYEFIQSEKNLKKVPENSLKDDTEKTSDTRIGIVGEELNASELKKSENLLAASNVLEGEGDSTRLQSCVSGKEQIKESQEASLASTMPEYCNFRRKETIDAHHQEKQPGKFQELLKTEQETKWRTSEEAFICELSEKYLRVNNDAFQCKPVNGCQGQENIQRGTDETSGCEETEKEINAADEYFECREEDNIVQGKLSEMDGNKMEANVIHVSNVFAKDVHPKTVSTNHEYENQRMSLNTDEHGCFPEGQEIEPKEAGFFFGQNKGNISNLAGQAFEWAANVTEQKTPLDIHDWKDNKENFNVLQVTNGCSDEANQLKEIQKFPMETEEELQLKAVKQNTSSTAGIKGVFGSDTAAAHEGCKKKINENIKDVQVVESNKFVKSAEIVCKGTENDNKLEDARKATSLGKQWHTCKAPQESSGNRGAGSPVENHSHGHETGDINRDKMENEQVSDSEEGKEREIRKLEEREREIMKLEGERETKRIELEEKEREKKLEEAKERERRRLKKEKEGQKRLEEEKERIRLEEERESERKKLEEEREKKRIEEERERKKLEEERERKKLEEELAEEREKKRIEEERERKKLEEELEEEREKKRIEEEREKKLEEETKRKKIEDEEREKKRLEEDNESRKSEKEERERKMSEEAEERRKLEEEKRKLEEERERRKVEEEERERRKMEEIERMRKKQEEEDRERSELEEKERERRKQEEERERRRLEDIERERRKLEEKVRERRRIEEAERERKLEEEKVRERQKIEEEKAREKKIDEEREKEWRKREEEKERDRKRLEEERDREREREKDRQAVERATQEAHERAFAEARERAERAAVERITAEARQRALAEARERAEKASAEALEKSMAEKASREARLRSERAAVERATAEARERAVEKAIAEKAAQDARERAEKLATTSREGMRQNFSNVRELDPQFQNAGTSSNSYQKYSDSLLNASFMNDKFGASEGESAIRCKARMERHQRTVERAAKALAEKNLRDIIAQREQAERNRLAETLAADVKRWSNGKEGNLRALLSTLQYILGPESGWQPIPLTDVVTAPAVKKAYRKATLCVHPDKLQQRGASIQQKYICEKVFDLLKEAWNKFNSEER